MTSDTPLLEVRGVTKRYGAVVATYLGRTAPTPSVISLMAAAAALVFGRQTEMSHQQEGVFTLRAEFDADVRLDIGQRVARVSGWRRKTNLVERQRSGE